MEQKYLIDTNIIIDFCENKLPANGKKFIAGVIDDNPILSVVNKIELLGFTVVTPEIELLVNTATILGLAEDIVDKTIQLRKHYRMKLPDAVIAATALVYNLNLITRNISDFKNISQLTLNNPWD